MPSPQKVIIDVDTGVDDAQAIILALSRPDVLDVLAVTCVQGNVDITNVCRNTLRVLSVCDRLNVPVYKGCEKPLTGEGPDATHYHGRDGMGDVANPEPVDMNLIQSEHATLALLRLVNQYPGEITLVALAPLTNIAVALRLDPDFGKKLKEMVIMGGNVQGKGNTSPAAEFNFRSDPEAAHVVLKEIGCPILLVPWETCADNGQSWTWTENWLKTDTRKGHFQNSIVQYSIGRLKSANRSHYRSCDLLAMAFIIDRSVATETEEFYGEVEMSGSITRGQLVCDWRKVMGRKVNIKAVTAVSVEKARVLYDAMLL
ncbi:nucleoside hydrolase-like [Argopecten irradians]|uniref:nucleoside hydrolase-like n=1 Tax=Argopecten irradians TaxID=31199 RepID=UPI0037194622